jgi:carboxymethylenebutenolidase
MGSVIHLQAQDGIELTAWLARPQGPVRGAVVVAQEIFGVNAHIRAVTERFAARGFLALAPDLFARLRPGVELGYDTESMAQGKDLKAAAEALPGEGVLQDLRAAAQWLQQDSGQRVGMVGFCWGGLLTWRAAERVTELSAAVCYYGGGMTTALEVGRQPRCPVLAHFGREDAWIPVPDVLAFSQAQPGVQVHLYEADHGFNCDQRASFDQASAIQAKDRTLAFFDQHLQGASTD